MYIHYDIKNEPTQNVKLNVINQHIIFNHMITKILMVSSSQGTKLWKTCFIEWEGIQLPCLKIQKLIIYLQLFLEKPNASI